MSFYIMNNITDSDWTSVNSASGIPVGTKLTLENKGSTTLTFKVSSTKPDASDTEGKTLYSVLKEGLSNTVLLSQEDELWVRTKRGEGANLYIQTTYPFNDSDNGLDPRLYTGLQGLTVQPFTEANVKNGTQFYISYEFTLPAASVQYAVFSTGSLPKNTLIKNRIINTDGGMRYTPRVGATGIVTGDSIGIYNLNARSSNTSINTANLVTSVVDEGVSFDVVRSAAGVGSNRQQGIFASDGVERLLQPDTDYLLKFENLDNKTIFVVFYTTWYEGPLSVDIL